MIRRAAPFLLGFAVTLGAAAFAADVAPPAPASPAPVTTAPAVQPAGRKIDFARDIKPILSDNCSICHGPDANRRKADLRLDVKEALFAPIDGAHPVVPGKPDQSTVFQRITTDDPKKLMPQPKSNKPRLKPEQVALIKQWIEEGAEWKDHWSYNPPTRPAVPAVEEPQKAFVRNAIDPFALVAMKHAGLKPSAEADRVTLIRRLSLDLIGLPPTSEEVDAFVNDKSPDAYDKLVERLLARPEYGERMAVHWLDLVRYADTIGFHSDNPREVWPFRDWVIKAFNENKPYDQFTVEQLAGDLLPNATREQRVGSAYNRLLITTGEGGAQAKEYVAKYAGDRVRNVSTVWMGATVGCAECHDHKYDPFTQKDFYRLAAFFADIQEPAIALPQPELTLPSPEQEAQLAKHAAAVAELKKTLATTTPEIASAQAAWEAAYHKEKDTTKWTPVEVTEATSEGGATLTIGKDNRTVLASGTNPANDTYTVKLLTRLKGISGLKLEVLPHDSLPAKGPGRAPNGNFVLSEVDVETYSAAAPATQPVAFTAVSADFEQQSHAKANPYGRWTVQAAVDGDKFGKSYGWAILPRAGQLHHAVFETPTDIGDGAPQNFTVRLKQNHGDGHAIGHFRFYVTDAPRPVRALPAKDIPAAIAAILEVPAEKRSDEQKAQVAAHFRSIYPGLQPAREELAKIEKANAELLAAIPKTLTSVSGPPRVTRVLARGNWQDETGEVVTPGVPAFMKQVNVPVDRGASRLDLAKWITARDNPLTARVLVNRLWKMYYGQGIAKPLDDLGAQGEWPTHPELLDWLAVEFMESGWDVKHVVRLMVTSGLYRQSSNASPELREKDPYNKLLARQAAFRLDAEFVRDNALFVSGLLVQKVGGPSVKPYQPAGYWDFLNFPKRQYDQGSGEALYRRGLYTWWQRTFLNPTLLNFDAATREECTAERVRSNTPQQALTLLNDPTYVEAARVFAERICKTDCPDDPGRVAWAFKRATARQPKPEETAVLTALLEKHRKHYAADKAAARALVTAGEAPDPKDVDPIELAAWTNVARTILNLHETVTRN